MLGDDEVIRSGVRGVLEMVEVERLEALGGHLDPWLLVVLPLACGKPGLAASLAGGAEKFRDRVVCVAGFFGRDVVCMVLHCEEGKFVVLGWCVCELVV